MSGPDGALDTETGPEADARSGNRRTVVIIVAVVLLALVLPAIGLAVYVWYVVKKTQRQSSVVACEMQMQVLVESMKLHRLQKRSWPTTLDQLVPYLETTEVPLDAWGHPFAYEVDDNAVWRLTSFGSDGIPGGEDDAADLIFDGVGRK